MVNQGKTLKRLKKEAEYEDHLARDIADYCEMCRDDIKDIPEEEKNEIIKLLNSIRNDSERHEVMIRRLIALVLDRGEAEY